MKNRNRIFFFFVGVVIIFILGFFLLSKILVYRNQKRFEKSTEFIRKSDSSYCECNKQITFFDISYGNFTVFDDSLSAKLQNDTKMYFLAHYGVWFSSINVVSCEKPIMDSAIVARFGSNFFNYIIKIDEKIKKENKTKEHKYTLTNLLTYNKEEVERINQFILDGLRKNKLIIKQPICYPRYLRLVVSVNKQGIIDSCYITHRQRSEVNIKALELINNYPYKFTPIKLKENNEPVPVEMEFEFDFGGGNPYFVHRL